MAVFHLKSSKVAGLTVDPEAFAGAVRFLADVEDAKNKTYSLVPGGANSPEAALMACSAHWLLGTKPDVTAPYLAKAAQALPGPSSGKDDSDLIANWMGSLTLSPQGGEIWKKWNTQMKDSLKASQRTNGLAQGSWDPSGRWTGAGRVFATALNQLCLEVFYRRQAPFNP